MSKQHIYKNITELYNSFRHMDLKTLEKVLGKDHSITKIVSNNGNKLGDVLGSIKRTIHNTSGDGEAFASVADDIKDALSKLEKHKSNSTTSKSVGELLSDVREVPTKTTHTTTDLNWPKHEESLISDTEYFLNKSKKPKSGRTLADVLGDFKPDPVEPVAPLKKAVEKAKTISKKTNIGPHTPKVTMPDDMSEWYHTVQKPGKDGKLVDVVVGEANVKKAKESAEILSSHIGQEVKVSLEGAGSGKDMILIDSAGTKYKVTRDGTIPKPVQPKVKAHESIKVNTGDTVNLSTGEVTRAAEAKPKITHPTSEEPLEKAKEFNKKHKKSTEKPISLNLDPEPLPSEEPLEKAKEFNKKHKKSKTKPKAKPKAKENKKQDTYQWEPYISSGKPESKGREFDGIKHNRKKSEKHMKNTSELLSQVRGSGDTAALTTGAAGLVLALSNQNDNLDKQANIIHNILGMVSSKPLLKTIDAVQDSSRVVKAVGRNAKRVSKNGRTIMKRAPRHIPTNLIGHADDFGAGLRRKAGRDADVVIAAAEEAKALDKVHTGDSSLKDELRDIVNKKSKKRVEKPFVTKTVVDPTGPPVSVDIPDLIEPEIIKGPVREIADGPLNPLLTKAKEKFELIKKNRKIKKYKKLRLEAKSKPGNPAHALMAVAGGGSLLYAANQDMG